jgi:DNA-binding response OmpR family regulator
MHTINAVIAHDNDAKGKFLAKSLQAHFHQVEFASDYETLRARIAKSHSQFAVVDLELLTSDELRKLCSDFSETEVVCVHRIPDDQLWTRAMEAGASDCCHIDDVRTILSAARAISPRRRAAVAA